MSIKDKPTTDTLVYGLGIASDFSSIGFDNLEFKPNSIFLKINTNGEALEAKETGEIEKTTGIKKIYKQEEIRKIDKFQTNFIPTNKFYKKNFEEPTDIYSVRISNDGMYELIIESTHNTALAYLNIEIDAGVNCVIQEKFITKKYFGAIIDITVHNGAQVQYVQMPNTYTYNSILEGASFIARNARIKRDASFQLFDFNARQSITKTTGHIYLQEQGATGSIYGAFKGDTQEYFDVEHIIEHNAPRTNSDMLVKGILDQRSQAIYRGLIKIHEGASKSDGAQKQETLLLSKDAKVSSVPELEIAHNDVKCSHSVSTSYVDAHKLFYFNMRGIDDEQAKKELVQGHIAPVIDRIQHGELRKKIYVAFGMKDYEYLGIVAARKEN